MFERNLCKIQYVGQSEGPFNIHLQNHRTNVQTETVIERLKGHKTF